MHELEIYYLDVGQGDCSLIVIKDTNVLPNIHIQYDPQIVRTVLIDCGTTSTNSTFNALPENTLTAKLRELRIRRLNAIVISHFDEDHFSGIVGLLRMAQTQPAIRNYLLDSKFYDQGLILRKNYRGPGFRWFTRFNHNDTNPLPGMELINNYFNLISDLNTNYQTNIQRMTERVFVGWPKDYNYGNWKSRNKAVVHPNESGVFDNTLSQQILIQTPLLTPTINLPNVFQNLDIDGDAWTQVTTLPCHYLLNQDILLDNTLPFLNNISLTCVAANGYTYNKNQPTDNFSPLLAYTGTGDKNKFSLGFVLNFNGFTHWFGGDLEDHQERRCVNYINSISDHGLDVIKASHHGSSASTSSQFLADTAPAAVIISSGNWSKHHHPHERVIQDLTEANWNLLVFMTNAPFFPNMQIPAFYDPGEINGRFFISGSSLDFQLGHIGLFVNQTHRYISYWEQNHSVDMLDQNNTIIPFGQLIRELERQGLFFREYTNIYGQGFVELIDIVNNRVDATISAGYLISTNRDTVYGKIIGRLLNRPF